MERNRPWTGGSDKEHTLIATALDSLPSRSRGISIGAALQTRAAALEVSRVFDAPTLTDALNRLADNGWNTVALPAFFQGHPIFPSAVWESYDLPAQHPRFKKWNPFETAFDVAWRRGLDLIVSHQPYLAAPGRSVGWFQTRSPISRKYPKWLALRHPSRKRRLSETAAARTYYCPVNRERRRFVCDTLHALLEDFPFHGLMIDLRHYPFTAGGESNYLPWCYCETCRDRTLGELGFDPAGVDFARERGMVERWKEWQTEQMDKALAYLRTRLMRARRSIRILGLLTTDSGLGDKDFRPLIHWRAWVEKSLVESIVLDRYSPDVAEFSSQVRRDLQTLPRNSLLLPMLPRKAKNGNDFLDIFDQEPLPGFMTRFEDWDLEDFDPAQRVSFQTPALPVESDSIGGICYLFERLARVLPQETEFVAFLSDLRLILTREDIPLTLDHLMVVGENIRGLHGKVAEGQMDFGREQDRVLHDLDLAVRLVYLAGYDVTQ